MIGRHRLLGPVPICQCCAQPFHFTIIRSYFVWSASFESQPVPKQSICWSRRHSCPAITSVIIYKVTNEYQSHQSQKCCQMTLMQKYYENSPNLKSTEQPFLWFLWSWPEAVDSFVELAREVEEDAKSSLVVKQSLRNASCNYLDIESF